MVFFAIHTNSGKAVYKAVEKNNSTRPCAHNNILPIF